MRLSPMAYQLLVQSARAAEEMKAMTDLAVECGGTLGTGADWDAVYMTPEQGAEYERRWKERWGNGTPLE